MPDAISFKLGRIAGYHEGETEGTLTERARIRRELLAGLPEPCDLSLNEIRDLIDRVCPAGPKETPEPAPAPPADSQEIQVELDDLEIQSAQRSPFGNQPTTLELAAKKAGCRVDECQRAVYDPRRMVHTFTFQREEP